MGSKKITPNVIARGIRFMPPGVKKYKDRNGIWIHRNYYTGGKAFDYYGREEAVGKKWQHQLVNEMCNHKLKNKTVQKLHDYGTALDYQGNRPGSTGLFNTQGKMSEEQIKEIKQLMKRSNSGFLDGVISLSESFANKTKFVTQDKWINLAQEELPKLFNELGFDSKNIIWQGAFHVNTDNPHIHFLAFEKEPQHWNYKRQKYEYKPWLAWPKFVDAFQKLRFRCSNYIENNKELYTNLNLTRDKILGFYNKTSKEYENSNLWQDLKQVYKNPEFEQANNLLDIVYSRLPKIGKTGYATDNIKVLRPTLNRITNLLINNSVVKTEYQNYFAEIKKLQNQFIDNAINNKLAINLAEEFVNKRIEEFYNRTGNQIIKFIKSVRTYNKNQSIYIKNKKVMNNIFRIKSQRFNLKFNSFTKLLINLNQVIKNEKIIANNRFNELQRISIKQRERR